MVYKFNLPEALKDESLQPYEQSELCCQTWFNGRIRCAHIEPN